MSAYATEMMEQFVAEATRMGSVVFLAQNPNDVSTYILEMARDRDATSVVKSKSSLANRIGLRNSLQDGGLDVKETDIGERIAQLSGEDPTWDGKPAAERSADQIAKILSPGGQGTARARKRTGEAKAKGARLDSQRFRRRQEATEFLHSPATPRTTATAMGTSSRSAN